MMCVWFWIVAAIAVIVTTLVVWIRIADAYAIRKQREFNRRRWEDEQLREQASRSAARRVAAPAKSPAPPRVYTQAELDQQASDAMVNICAASYIP